MRVEKIPGRLPKFWDSSVVYVSNLESLFYGNEAETRTLRDQVSGLDGYGGRLVPILDLLFRGGSNTLVLGKPPADALLDYFSQDLQLRLPELAVLSRAEHRLSALLEENPNSDASAEDLAAVQKIRANSSDHVLGFVTDDALLEIAEKLGKQAINTTLASKNGNNKLLLHQHMERSGFPVFDTELCDGPEHVRACLEKLSASGYSEGVIKSQIGASGVGLIKTSTSALDLHVDKFMFHEGPCMIQGWLDSTVDGLRGLGSPSVQMFLDDDMAQLFDVTDQILGHDSVHEGNLAPPSFAAHSPEIVDELLRQSEVAATWLHEQGYRGTASTDFLLVEKNGRTEAYVCEINARVTGATYPAVLARHLTDGQSWLMRNIRFSRSISASDLLKELDEAALLFRPGQQSGALPINLNRDAADLITKGQFLFLGADAAECEARQNEMMSVLPVTLKYDRD